MGEEMGGNGIGDSIFGHRWSRSLDCGDWEDLFVAMFVSKKGAGAAPWLLVAGGGDF
jgi:hypothetical protein